MGRGQCWGIAWEAFALHQPSVRDGAHTPEDDDSHPSRGAKGREEQQASSPLALLFVVFILRSRPRGVLSRLFSSIGSEDVESKPPLSPFFYLLEKRFRGTVLIQQPYDVQPPSLLPHAFRIPVPSERNGGS